MATVVLHCGLAVSAATPAAAQIAAGGSVSGYVGDTGSGMLSRVAVTATSASEPHVQTALTDATGFYVLSRLAPAQYSITAERQGFARVNRENVLIREGLNVTLNLTMPLGALSDVITVVADTPMIESKTAVQAMNVSGDLQRALPTSSLRNWDDFLVLAPGIVTTQARLQTYALHGTTHASGVFLVDGADATSVLQGSTLYSQFSHETFNDIQVKTGAVDASAPLGLGPVVTIATRSGTNQFHGAINVAYQPLRWNGSNTPGGQDLTVDVLQPEGSIGGPLARDHWWFFASSRIARDHTGVPRSAAQVTFLRAIDPAFSLFDNDRSGQFVFGKVTGQLSPSHQLMASFSRDVLSLGGAQPNEAANFRVVTTGGPGAFARLSSVWSPSLATRWSFGYNGKKQQNLNLQPGVTGTIIYQNVLSLGGRLLGIGPIGVVDASPSPGIDFNVHMWTIAGDATYYRSGLLGSHEFQAGVYLQPQRHDEWITHYNNGGAQLQEMALRDPANPSAGLFPFHRQIYDVAEIATTDVDSRDAAFYGQDAWRIAARSTITAGLRVDVIRRFDRLFGVVTQRSAEVGPRVGATFLLTADGRNALRASWSRLHENLSQNETRAGTNVAGARDLYDVARDGTFSTVFVTPAARALSSNLTIDLDHYHQGHVDETTVGYRRQLGGQLSVDASIIHRTYRDRPSLVDTNGIYSDGVFAGYRDVTQNEIYRLAANSWNWPVMTAFQVQAAKHTSRIKFTGSYTRASDYLDGTWQPNDPASFIQPGAFPNRNGIGFVIGCTTSGASCPDANSLTAGFGGGTWRHHIAAAGVSYQGPAHVQLAATYQFQTGPYSGPIQRLASVDPRFGPPTITLSNGRIVSNPLSTPIRFAYETRGDGQLELGALHIWNMRVGRWFLVGSAVIEAAIDVLNVTNHGADQAFQPGANQQFSPFFGAGIMRQFPRAVQLSVRISL